MSCNDCALILRFAIESSRLFLTAKPSFFSYFPSLVTVHCVLMLTVRPSLVSFPPSVVTRDVDTTVLLQCMAFGIPSPNITWFRNSRPVDMSTATRFVCYLQYVVAVQIYAKFLRIACCRYQCMFLDGEAGACHKAPRH